MMTGKPRFFSREADLGHNKSSFALRKRKRASVACTSCRARKVRCDIQFREGNCTNCALDKVACETTPLVRKRPKNPELVSQESRKSMSSSSPSDELCEHTQESDHSSLTNPPHLNPAYDSDELLVRQGQEPVTVPDQSLRRHLVRCYLRHVHPSLPVMTIHDLVDIIDLRDGSPSCGWFVLNALFAASASFVDLDILRDFGFQSLNDASGSFFFRAKALYPVELPQKTYSATQGLLLMSFAEGVSSSRDAWFWLGLVHTVAVAIRLDSEPPCTMQPERGLRKRLWWSLYSQFSLLNLDADTKPRIRMNHAAVSPLSDEDFEREIPEALLTHTKRLDLLPSPNVWSEIGLPFMRRLELFHLYNECIEWRHTSHKADDLATSTARVIRSLSNSDSIRKLSGSSENLENINFFPSRLDRYYEDGHPPQVLETDLQKSVALLDMERLLFNPI